MLPLLVSDKSEVESSFDSWLTGPIVRCGWVTIPIASTQYSSDTMSAPVVSVYRRCTSAFHIAQHPASTIAAISQGVPNVLV